MFSQNRHVGGRKLLLLAAFLSGASWSGLATAQASPAEIARADADVADLEVKLIEAQLNRAKLRAAQLRAGTQTSGSANSAATQTAAATTPQTTPPLNQSRGDADGAKDGSKGTSGEAKPGSGNQKEGDAPDAEDAVTQGRKEFGGLEFGAGISFTLDVGQNDRVTEAELVNGIVRVKDEDNGRARIMLESHYFFKPCQYSDGTAKPNCELLFGLKPGDFGFGPFIALQPGSEEIIQAVAIGGMVGFRRPGEGTESFNLGLGLVIDPNTRILGDGIVANEPLPAGETAIRYKEKMQTGLLLLASFGF